MDPRYKIVSLRKGVREGRSRRKLVRDLSIHQSDVGAVVLMDYREGYRKARNEPPGRGDREFISKRQILHVKEAADPDG